MIGTGIYGEKFGNIAYRDKFMGPMTFAPIVIRERGVYSGHAEHELITVKQLLLNLQMYTAVLVELAK